jgi:uncharacterized protein (TIGR03437 family)
MNRWFCVLSLAFSIHLQGSATNTIAHLPNIQIKAAKVDSSGNIYIAGQTTSGAYLSKLSSDGLTTFYAVMIGGSSTAATALGLDASGDLYVAGTTTASDFPNGGGATAFAVKLDGKGNIVYSTGIGGTATTVPQSVAVNSKGELIVAGLQTANAQTQPVPSLFLLKISADGSTTVSGPAGIGGLVTVDAQDNIYVVGVPPSTQTAGPAATPGAFQGVPETYLCGCPFLGYICGGNQFAASLSPDLSQTRFLTYVTARFGATPSYIALDPQGNILIAGTTIAPGYPTTPGSYQPIYTAAARVEETCGPPIPLEITSPSGYVTLLKPDGSGLVFSTFFSGSNSDGLSFAALTSSGIYLGGQASSVDLPGFDGGVPSACIPVGFLTRMTLDGTAVTPTSTPAGTPLAYDPTTSTLLYVFGSNLLRFDPTQSTPIACVLASADLTPVTATAPGELLTMYGRFLYLQQDGFGETTTITPEQGVFPVTSQGLGVMSNQTPAPLLYLSEQQINFQTPYELSGAPQANLVLTYADVNGNNVSDSRTLDVAASSPVAFIPELAPQAFPAENSPLALNSDGTVNSTSNPAASGSKVTIFLDGLGVTSPAPATGAVTTGSSIPLNVPLTITPYCSGTTCYPVPVSAVASTLPGSISGVTQVQLVMPANPYPPAPFQVIFSLSAGSVAVRDLNLSLWVK